jgi:DNA-binding transcriptional LysR family regulator
MRIRHLRHFLAVAEDESFTRAAARIHVEPSPLSRAVKVLEDDLEIRLLRRGKGKVRLTRAGEVFREDARRILALMDEARLRARAAEKGFHRFLRVGLADALAQPRLTRLLARCREEEPLTAIRLIEMTAGALPKAFDHEQIDAGFTLCAGQEDGLVRAAVWSDRPLIAIPRNHPLLSCAQISPREIARQPLILCPPASGGFELVRRWFDEARVPEPAVAEYVCGHEPMLMLVAAGYGIGVGLASQLAQHRHPGVILRPATADAPDFVTYADTPDRPPSETVRRFIARARRIGESRESGPNAVD